LRSDFPVTVDGLTQVQRAWIPYRDVSVALLLAINPALDKNGLTSRLTEQRMEDLQQILHIEN
jgi:uncharacterized protein YecT (DUF1311 family)